MSAVQAQPTIEIALDRAIDFLARSQRPHGEFKTLLGFDPALTNAQIDSSPFATTFVVYALNEVKNERSIGMMMKAVDFLAREMEFGGVWRYYSSLQFKHCKVPPDLDDTSCSTYALRLAGRRTPDNEWIFHYSRDESGRFLTWILRKPGLKFAPRFWFSRMAGWVQAEYLRWAAPPAGPDVDPKFLVARRDPVPVADVDPVVNANVILLLGETDETTAALQYLIDAIRTEPSEQFSLYYRDILALYYMVARARRHSAPTLAVVGGCIVEKIVRRQQVDGSFGNPLLTALAASALLTFDPHNPALSAAMMSILRSQREDGSWSIHPFYCAGSDLFWGSEELTTGFCVEALARFSRQNNQPGHSPDTATTNAIVH